MELANFNNFSSVASQFKQNKAQSKQLQDTVHNYIEQHTQIEKQQLEQAIQNYNKKVQSIVQDKQDDIKQIEHYEEQISTTLQETYQAFHEATQQILSNDTLNNDQKENKIQQISDYIMDNLYTQEEIEQFKAFAEQFEILLPGNNYTKRVQNVNHDSQSHSKLSIRYS